MTTSESKGRFFTKRIDSNRDWNALVRGSRNRGRIFSAGVVRRDGRRVLWVVCGDGVGNARRTSTQSIIPLNAAPRCCGVARIWRWEGATGCLGLWGTEVPQRPPNHHRGVCLPVRVRGQSPPKALPNHFVYLAKLHEPLVKHEKNLGCSTCLSAELSSS